MKELRRDIHWESHWYFHVWRFEHAEFGTVVVFLKYVKVRPDVIQYCTIIEFAVICAHSLAMQNEKPCVHGHGRDDRRDGGGTDIEP